MRKLIAIAFVILSLSACGEAEPKSSEGDLEDLYDDCHIDPDGALGPRWDCD